MIASSKAALRKEMITKRNMLAERTEKSRAIAQSLFTLPELKDASCIAFYLSKGSEVETREMIASAIAMGKEVLVPVTNNKIELVQFTSFEDLAPARFGVMEPKTKRNGTAPDAIIVPGLAFDMDMHRLGYGKGHYDKLLKKLNSIRIGICFDMQIIEKIPRHEHDERLHIIVSEKRTIRR